MKKAVPGDRVMITEKCSNRLSNDYIEAGMLLKVETVYICPNYGDYLYSVRNPYYKDEFLVKRDEVILENENMEKIDVSFTLVEVINKD